MQKSGSAKKNLFSLVVLLALVLLFNSCFVSASWLGNIFNGHAVDSSGSQQNSWWNNLIKSISRSSGSYVPVIPVCVGTIPLNSVLCPGDTQNLTNTTQITLASSCTSTTKCEYVCSSSSNYPNGVGHQATAVGVPIDVVGVPAGQAGTGEGRSLGAPPVPPRQAPAVAGNQPAG